MICLTEQEISDWMRKHGHHDEKDLMLPISFYAPKKHSVTEALVEFVLRQVFVGGEVLMIIEDTDVGYFRHTRIFEGVRRLAGESRPVDEAPGYMFPMHEWQEVITLFSLTSSFGWRCYLYGEGEQLTLFNWEGEIFDLWPGNEKGHLAALEVLKEFKLEQIKRGKIERVSSDEGDLPT